ncbi:hypothetical protein [Novosphingobium sp.]|uniref:hypothetical protein n=1 Tax=Novosphingobium sp. TaxID=1874826 RepID=UPI0027341C43|nr:hypothetical protein [Novosphingobium sp.]MDP3907898.1 hypothetical protein [Novosphingobium sp.]
MGQVNVNYDDRLLDGIDRLCSARTLSRAELMRAIATEAVEAHDAGRLAFQIEDGPRIDGSLNALAAQVREAVVELERVQRSTQRHEKRMMDAWVGNEESIRQAQENLTARVNDINRKSYEPFVNKVRDVIALIEGLKPQIAKTQEAGLAKVLDRLEAVRAEAVAPRNHYKVVFPGDFSLRFLVALASVIGLVGAFVVLLAAANMAWLGVPIAKRALPTTELVCRVINDRYGVRDCQVPAEYRRGYVPPARSAK